MASTSKSTAATVLHEIMQMNRKGVFDDQAIIEVNEENAMEVKVTLTPSAGLFAGTEIPFTFEFSDAYPSTAPSPKCEAVVYHSNIGEDGGVCLNMFSEPDPSYRFEHYINGLLWLLNNQNFNSQLNGYVIQRKSFPLDFKLSTLGYQVNGLCCTKIRTKPLDKKDILEIMAEIVREAPKRADDKTLADFKSLFLAHAHYDFLLDHNPFLQLLQIRQKTETFPGTFRFVNSVCTKVDVRARNLKVEPNLVLKEMVILVDGTLTLLITNGVDQIDFQHLEQILNKKIEIRKAGEMKRENQANVLEVSLADWTGPVLLDQSLLSEEKFYASTGYPRFLVRSTLADLLSLRPDLSVTNVDLRKIPQPLPLPVEVPSQTEATENSEKAAAETTPTPTDSTQVSLPVEVLPQTVSTESQVSSEQVLQTEEKARESAKKDKVAALALDPLLQTRTLSEEAAVVIR